MKIWAYLTCTCVCVHVCVYIYIYMKMVECNGGVRRVLRGTTNDNEGMKIWMALPEWRVTKFLLKVDMVNLLEEMLEFVTCVRVCGHLDG